MELFHFKRQRKLSLRFLAGYLLGAAIQQDTHDSVVDARTALSLFQARPKIPILRKQNFVIRYHTVYCTLSVMSASWDELCMPRTLGIWHFPEHMQCRLTWCMYGCMAGTPVS